MMKVKLMLKMLSFLNITFKCSSRRVAKIKEITLGKGNLRVSAIILG